MKRVTGIGGIFFKCQDPETLKAWYQTHLGFDITGFGAVFAWGADTAAASGQTIWSPFPTSTEYFAPSTKEFMINYRVENIETLVAALKAEGVTVLDEVTDYGEYGKFVHILDCEGNKIELWQPPTA